jgi:hypothetical protein
MNTTKTACPDLLAPWLTYKASLFKHQPKKQLARGVRVDVTAIKDPEANAFSS